MHPVNTRCRKEMSFSSSQKKTFVKFIANQVKKPPVVERLTNQLIEYQSTTWWRISCSHLNTVSEPTETFMKDNQAKEAYKNTLKL